MAAVDETGLEKADDLSPWDVSYELRLGAGYKDNLLLDNVASEDSAFIRAVGEVSIVRLPLDGTEFVFLFSGEQTRYWEAQTVDQESLLITVAQIKKYWADDWVAGIAFQHLYQDEVFDASVTETSRATLRLKGHVLRVRPALRRNLPRNFWLETELALDREEVAAPLDDSWDGGPKLTLGRDYGHRSNVSLGYEFNHRAYDQRVALDALGLTTNGKGLTFEQHEVRVENRHYWDAARAWRSTTRLGFAASEDNGGGYFNYRRYQLAEQLRFVRKPWELQAQTRLSYYDYPIQTVSLADPATRRKLLLTLEFRAEWTFARHWKFYGSYEHERSLSNLVVDEYQVNTVGAGVNWAF